MSASLRWRFPWCRCSEHAARAPACSVTAAAKFLAATSARHPDAATGTCSIRLMVSKSSQDPRTLTLGGEISRTAVQGHVEAGR